MKILSKTSDNLKRSYNVLIDIEEVNRAVDNKLGEVAQRTKMDGFRPGKVPIDVIRRLRGETVKADALKSLVAETAQRILREENSPPSFGLTTSVVREDAEGVEFSMNFELIPSVELIDFSTIEIVKYIPEVTEKEIIEVFDELREHYKKWVEEPEDTLIEIGHKVFVDLAIKTKLKKHINETANDVNFVIGDAELIEDFWKPLLGAKVGDTKEFVVNYSADLADKVLAGKTIEYSASVKKVQKAVDYELDEEFAKAIGHDDMEKAREWAKQRAWVRYDYISKDLMKRDLLEKISEMFDFAIPGSMLDLEYSEVVRQIIEEAKKINKKITSVILRECRKIAEQRVRIGFVVAEVAKRENIVATRSEVSKTIQSIATMYPGREKAIWEMYSNGEAVGAIVGPILESKVVAFLFDRIKIREEICSVERLIELDEEPFDFFKDDEDQSNTSNDNAEQVKALDAPKSEQTETPETQPEVLETQTETSETQPEILEAQTETPETQPEILEAHKAHKSKQIETKAHKSEQAEAAPKAHKSKQTETSKTHQSEHVENDVSEVKKPRKKLPAEASSSEKAPKKTRRKKTEE
ncbi:MAG: trigger factor [Holosporaceae bacterium]|nr:trigger factor [Holosporaceae bacterium]